MSIQENLSIRRNWLYAAERLISSFGSMLITFAIAASYSKTQFGRFAYIQNILFFALPLALSAIEPLLQRQIANAGSQIEARARIVSAIVLCWSWSVLALIVTKALSLENDSDDQDYSIALYLGFVSVFPGALLVFEAALRDDKGKETIVRARLTATVIATALKLVIILFHRPLYEIFAILSVEYLIIVAFYLPSFMRWRLASAVGDFVNFGKSALVIFKLTIPSIAAGLVLVVQFRGGYFFLAASVGFSGLADYMLALQVTGVVASLFAVTLNSTTGRLTAARQLETPLAFHNATTDLFFEVSRLAWFVAWSIGALIVIVECTFGLAAYSDSIALFLVALLAIPINASGAVRALVINSFGSTKVHLFAAVLGLSVSFSAYIAFGSVLTSLSAISILLVSNFLAGTLSSCLFSSTKRFAVIQLQALLTPWISVQRK